MVQKRGSELPSVSEILWAAAATVFLVGVVGLHAVATNAPWPGREYGLASTTGQQLVDLGVAPKVIESADVCLSR